MNNKGQMGLGLVWGIIGLVVTILVFVAFLPTIQEQFAGTRDQDVLNCETTNPGNICPNVTNGWCYNSTIESEDVACTFMSLGTPLIVIFVILGAIGLMLAGRMMSPSQPSYEGY